MEVEEAINTDLDLGYRQMFWGSWNETKSQEIQGNGGRKDNRQSWGWIWQHSYRNRKQNLILWIESLSPTLPRFAK